jgi:hypothetical protein
VFYGAAAHTYRKEADAAAFFFPSDCKIEINFLNFLLQKYEKKVIIIPSRENQFKKMYKNKF